MNINNLFFVSQNVEIKRKTTLCSEYGIGCTPEIAIDQHWAKLTELEANEYLVINAMSLEKRRAYRWNGFMWKEISE
jgi:hypothetical protein